MIDIGHEATDKKIAELDKEIHKVYSEAAIDIQKKLDDFNERHAAKEAIMVQKLKNNGITFDQFSSWQKGQIFQTKQWEAKREQIVGTLTHSNQIAAQIVNGQTANAFGFNATYMNYSLEHSAGVDFGFGIYDSATVSKLIKSNPQILPKWRIDEKKDYIWNKKQVNLAVTQGIIQGETLDQITKRISNGLVMKNENLAKTFARTAMTGAQNSGRLQSLKEAKKLGIEVMKEWMATLDSHTRDSHASMDGEQVAVYSKFSNGLYYPAEAGGDPAEVYNCRCTMVGDLKKYPEKYKRYDNIDGKPIDNMTYKEWAKAKGKTKATPKTKPKVTVPRIDYSKFGGKEIYDIMSKFDSYDDFFDRSTLEEWDAVAHALKGHEVKELYRQGLKPVAVKPTTPTKTTTAKSATKTAKATTTKTVKGAVPRTASYIDDVTAKSMATYSLDSNISSSISKVAADLGVTDAEAKSMIETGLKRIVDESEFTMRIRARNLEKVLDEGYFKNQFETGSSGGCFNPSRRKKLENRMFNVPKDGISDADRPVYGMFCPRWNANSDAIKDYYKNGAGSWYGDGITVVLKKESVINNATMTIGDSLDYEWSLVSTEVNNIIYAGSYEDGRRMAEIAKITESTPIEEVHATMMDFAYKSDHYFEYQLHGQQTHSIDNIDYVIINERSANSNPDLLQKLNDMGIPYYINDI